MDWDLINFMKAHGGCSQIFLIIIIKMIAINEWLIPIIVNSIYIFRVIRTWPCNQTAKITFHIFWCLFNRAYTSESSLSIFPTRISSMRGRVMSNKVWSWLVRLAMSLQYKLLKYCTYLYVHFVIHSVRNRVFSNVAKWSRTSEDGSVASQ